MTRSGLCAAVLCGALGLLPGPVRAQSAASPSPGGLEAWLSDVSAGLTRVDSLATAGRQDAAVRLALQLYLDDYERIEGYYGTGGEYGAPGLSERVSAGEDAFHTLLRAGDGASVHATVAQLQETVRSIGALARSAGVSLTPAAPEVVAPVSAPQLKPVRTPEVASILTDVDAAAAAYSRGDAQTALRRIEHAYLEGFEPLESRLPAARVRRVERLFHLTLRPEMARGAPNARVQRGFIALRAELRGADASLEAGAPFWFGAINSFAIVVREGLEAVLLIGAILAYLTAMGAERRTRRQIYAGVGAGVVATLVLWGVAGELVPIDGANRELLEGVTALLAVGVLLYVSNWLFQKTYIHDWKDYLRERVGVAATTGSALAMASLAFAAVFREGFETVLFYQALTFDAGIGAVLAGFVPGLLLITAIGYGIIRMGVRLPLRRVFAATNAVLLYLAFVFIGKGIYNLQEAGVFAPHPVSWLPDHPALVQLLGLYPVVETLAGQGVFLLLLGLTYLWYRRRLARVVGHLGSRSGPTRNAA